MTIFWEPNLPNGWKTNIANGHFGQISEQQAPRILHAGIWPEGNHDRLRYEASFKIDETERAKAWVEQQLNRLAAKP